MYVKDSVIEAQIEKDLEKQHLKGRIDEIEHQIRRKKKGRRRCSGLRERLKKLRGEFKLLQN